MTKNYHYEAKAEKLESYGVNYISYAIFTEEEGHAAAILHDVTTSQEEASKICLLLNAHELEPEQARYVLEDYIMEKYLPEGVA